MGVVIMNLIVSQKELCTLIYDELHLSTEQTHSFEEIGNMLPQFADPDLLFAMPPPYWQRLKTEFHCLICTKDKKYEPLRKQLRSTTKRSQTLIVSSLSVAMAHAVGVAAGVLTPFCALCLLALATTGRSAYCSGIDFNASIRTSEIKNTDKRGTKRRALAT